MLVRACGASLLIRTVNDAKRWLSFQCRLTVAGEPGGGARSLAAGGRQRRCPVRRGDGLLLSGLDAAGGIADGAAGPAQPRRSAPARGAASILNGPHQTRCGSRPRLAAASAPAIPADHIGPQRPAESGGAAALPPALRRPA